MTKTARFILIAGFLSGAALLSILLSALAMQAGDDRLASWSSKVALAFAVGLVIYVLPRLAQNFRLEALRSELNTRLSVGGWLFLAACVVVGALALITVNNLLYLVFSVMGATLLVCAVACRLNAHALDVSIRFPDHIYAGEPARFDVTAHNRKRVLPAFSLSIQGKSPAPVHLGHFALISARSSARSLFNFEFPRRGIYPVRGFSVRSRFPFGLIERRRQINANGEIVVYPSPQPVDDFYHLLPFTQGQTEMPVRGSGTDLYAIRQYIRSDHPHHINWKATAKTTQMMVREFARDDDRRVTVALDDGAFSTEAEAFSTEGDRTPDADHRPPATGHSFERAVTLAASLIAHFGSEGAQVRLITSREDSGFGAGLGQRLRIFRILAGVEQTATTTSDDVTERIPALIADERFKILITPAPRGSIPAHLWRSAHVIYFDDLDYLDHDVSV
jgi:uncharacterized protein (DUF58 family)